MDVPVAKFIFWVGPVTSQDYALQRNPNMGTRVKAWLFLFLPKVSAYLQFFEDPNYVNETVIVRLQQKDKAGFCWLEFHTNQSLQWKNKVVVVDPIFCLNLLRFCQVQ